MTKGGVIQTTDAKDDYAYLIGTTVIPLNNELKPCPFCGHKASPNSNHGFYYITCHNCGIRTSDYRSKEKVLKVWNSRINN